MEQLNKNELTDYICSQLDHFYPDKYNARPFVLKHIDESTDRLLYSLKHVKLVGYKTFSYLHSDLYAQFIYYLSNTIWRNEQNNHVAAKLFYLNKTLHGLNCMYDTTLPDIFLLIHCVGTVLGKAFYSDYFVACHNVTVGADKDFFPNILERVYMGPGSSIVGKCTVGSNSHLAINSIVLNQDVKDDCVVVGHSPNLILKSLKRNLLTDQYFL